MIYVGYRIHITFLLIKKYLNLNVKDVKMNYVTTNGYHLFYFSKPFVSIFHILFGVHYHVVVELMFVILSMLRLIINQLIQQQKMINIKQN
jgi:heme/copper-type cytochrome/quinol oxidase subunit 3